MTEVSSGHALNLLLDDLLKLEKQGVKLPNVQVASSVLDHLNLTPVAERGNFGLLKNGSTVTWPLAWHEETLAKVSEDLRNEVNSLLQTAISRLKEGQDDGDQVIKLKQDVETLRERLKAHISDLSANTYISAKRQLDELENAVTGLEGKNAAEFVKGTLRPNPENIKTVQDLVQFMGSKGLHFAPSVEGDEAAYTSLQHGLAMADRSGDTAGTVANGEL
jgi:hypothetical protein